MLPSKRVAARQSQIPAAPAPLVLIGNTYEKLPAGAAVFELGLAVGCHGRLVLHPWYSQRCWKSQQRHPARSCSSTVSLVDDSVDYRLLLATEILHEVVEADRETAFIRTAGADGQCDRFIE